MVQPKKLWKHEKLKKYEISLLLFFKMNAKIDIATVVNLSLTILYMPLCFYL